jgi:signal transduction histidine kinase/ActR/RegA family two-component response regulator
MNIGEKLAKAESLRIKHKRNVLKVLFLYLGLLLLATSLSYRIYSNFADDTIVEQSKALQELNREIIREELNATVNDLRYLTESVKAYSNLNAYPPQLAESLEDHFQKFSTHHPIYDQLRFLDKKGKEALRVNYNLQSGSGVLVPNESLQDKSRRYYFLNSIALAQNTCYLSPLDLNIEKGHVEQISSIDYENLKESAQKTWRSVGNGFYAKPMLRLGIPLKDSSGSPGGVVLINYQANHLLVRLQRNRKMDVSLYNRDGYTLHADLPRQEWGFMYEDRRHFNLSEQKPELWDKVQQYPNDSVAVEEINGEYFIFSWLNPEELLDCEKPKKQLRWLLVNHISHEMMALEKRHVLREHFIVYVLLSLFGSLFIILFFKQYYYRKEQEQKAIENEHKIRTEKLSSLGTLAGGIAHDFNNLFSALYGLISLARYTKKEGKSTEEYLEEAEKTIGRARMLTQNLLTFSKGGEPVLESLNLEEGVGDLLNIQFSKSHVKTHLECSDALHFANADEEQIYLAFSHFFQNSLEAIGDDDGNIWVYIDNAELGQDNSLSLKAGKYLKIRIKDSGCGISEQSVPYIYDPYYTSKKGHNGLGLALAHSIVRQHQGKILLANHLNGCEFVIYLPALNSIINRNEGENEKNNKQIHSSTLGVQRVKKVLLLDDDEVFCTITAQMLRDMGYYCDVANDGVQALKLFRTKKKKNELYDMMIFDLNIPGGMGGLETAQVVLLEDPHMKILVSSGNKSHPALQNYTQYGFLAALVKPYTYSQLRDTLDMFNSLESSL